MRKCWLLASFVFIFLLVDLVVVFKLRENKLYSSQEIENMRLIVKELGLSDLAVTTEARYTRHPAASDPVVPFMDHPGNIEHFPSGSFWHPVE